jgi:hypothetical protein
VSEAGLDDLGMLVLGNERCDIGVAQIVEAQWLDYRESYALIDIRASLRPRQVCVSQ